MEEKETKTISFKDIGKLIKSNLILIIAVVVISALLGVAYALLIQPTEYTATVLLEVSYKESTDVDGSTTSTEKNNSDSSTYSFARYLPKGYEVLFTSPAYLDEFNSAVDKYNENPENVTDKSKISGGGLSFNIDDELDVLFTVSYTVSDKGTPDSVMKTQVVDTLNSYINESIKKTNGNSKSIYADRLTVISDATESTVKTNNGAFKSVAIATLIGIVIAFVILLVKYLLDETVGEKEDVEELTNTTVIAFIPLVQNNSETVSKKLATASQEGGNDNA